jgi:hypothetical protein
MKRDKSPIEEWKERGHKLGAIGNMCEVQKNKELEAIDKKRKDLSGKAVDLGKRPCNPSPELQVILLKNNSLLWDKTEVYEKYAEQEKALRIQAVNQLRKHEEKMFGQISDIEERKVDQSSGNKEPTSKRPRVKMMKSEGNPTEEDVEQRINDLIEKGDAITRESFHQGRTQDETKKTECETPRTHRPIPQERHTMS